MSEKISLQVFIQNNSNPDKHIVVVDTDTFAVQIINKNDQGKVNLIHSIESDDKDSDLLNNSINNFLSKNNLDISIDELYENILTIDARMMKNYMATDGARDGQLFIINTRPFFCHEIVEIFSDVEHRMESVYSNISAFCNDSSVDESDINIVLCGKTSGVFLMPYYLKKFFTFEPLLEDNRFISNNYLIDDSVLEFSGEADKNMYASLRLVLSTLSSSGVDIDLHKAVDPILFTSEDKLRIETDALYCSVDIPATNSKMSILQIAWLKENDKEYISLNGNKIELDSLGWQQKEGV